MSAIRFLCVLGFIAYFPTTLFAQTPPVDNCKYFNKFTVDSRPLMTVDGSDKLDTTLYSTAESHNFHPIGLMGDPFLFLDGTTYHLWFSARNRAFIQGIGHSSSSTMAPFSWTDTKDINNDTLLDLLPEASPGWDHVGLETAAILLEEVVTGETGQAGNNGEYRLYYSGVKTNDDYEIGVATSTSPNGPWTKYPSGSPAASIFSVDPSIEWEQPTQAYDENGTPIPNKLAGGVLEPSVIYDSANNEYLMWYATIGIYPCPGAPVGTGPPLCNLLPGQPGYPGLAGTWAGRIGFAKSPNGITGWIRQHPTGTTNWVLGPGSGSAWDSLVVGHPHVIARLNNTGYHMFYVGQRDVNSEVISGLGHAYSSDGVTWEKNPNNPIITSKDPAPSRSEAEWLDYILGGPTAMYETDGSLKLTFMASPIPDFAMVNFGLATTTCDVTN